MVILALDTSTRTGSCALVRDGVVLAEQPGDTARSHGQRLPRELALVLEHGGLALSEVEVLAVATGPGSFTGLRVGIATMQGLALSLGLPLVGISAFDALAVAARGEIAGALARVATWIDAWRGEVYAAVYEQGCAVSDPTVELPATLLQRLRGEETVFIGDGATVHARAIVEALGDLGVLAPRLEPPLASVVARLAAARVASGHRPGPEEIRPMYVRRPDVEMARDGRGGR